MMRLIVGVVVFALVSIAVPVSAQYAPDRAGGQIAGAVRFHLDVPLLRYLSVTTSSDAFGSMDRTDNILSFGGPSLFSLLTGARGGGAGVGAPGFGLGYAVSDDIVIGTALQFAYETLSREDSTSDSSSLLTFGVEPYVEYLGGEGSTKPFVGGTAYVRTLVPIDGGDAQSVVGGGLLGGAYFFVSEGCSVDLTGKLTYGVQVGGTSSGSSVSILDVLATVGVSAWIL
jgi:hypothetical protein